MALSTFNQPFTLVTTVFNEMRRLDQTIADIEAQTLKPTELIITDAGSKDGTWERLQRWAAESTIKVVPIQELKCNVARGRNLAIAQASHQLIASTDFGCRFAPTWLEELMAPFAIDPQLQVVGGAFTIIRDEVDVLPAKADYVLSNGYPVVMDEYFSVSSRSIAYKKEVWDTIGGYPEWLTLAADDTIFWRQIRQHGFTHVFAPTPNVFWLRHKTFKGFGKEAFRYGLGDGESLINFKNFVSHVVETSCRYVLFAGIVLQPFVYPALGWFGLAILVPFLIGLRSYLFAFKRWSAFKHLPGYGLSVLFGCFWMIEVTRRFYIRGYLKGWLQARPDQKEARKKLGVR